MWGISRTSFYLVGEVLQGLRQIQILRCSQVRQCQNVTWEGLTLSRSPHCDIAHRSKVLTNFCVCTEIWKLFVLLFLVKWCGRISLCSILFIQCQWAPACGGGCLANHPHVLRCAYRSNINVLILKTIRWHRLLRKHKFPFKPCVFLL